MNTTPLISQLAAKIVEYVRTQDDPHGMRLIERKLAEHLKVSRSPVRSALKVLEDQGFVQTAPTGGFLVSWKGGEIRLPQLDDPVQEDGEVYSKIAVDRLEGRLPDRVTEKELCRLYDLTKGQLAKILRKIHSEGWIERLPGHGWEFLPMLTSMQAYKDSYRFRLTIEPAAILEPTFKLNRAALEACRAQQQQLIDGDIWNVSNPDLFDLNSQLHEAIIECSGNLFFIESLRRIDRIRRLIEYKRSLDRKYAIVRSQEHVQLVDLLLEDKRQLAAAYMSQHLSSVSMMKVATRPHDEF
ncbi:MULTISPECIES: GntR family transcriptional regulator [Rhizobium/Agrobacterium group]|uniref:GntR family transcriptional regulator n=1 Tax=Rhizobium/Agrobacterium group TaxID=227290 RepID=UPI002B2586D2|nr:MULTISPECIES: GntR family transcriptional regulator [unclassified Rhizobium]